MNKLIWGVPVLCLPFLSGAFPQASFQARADLATLMPEASLVFVEGPGLAPILAKGLEHPFVEQVLDSALMRLALAKAERTPEQAIALASDYIGAPLLPTLAQCSAGGAAFALGLKRGKPAYSLALRASEAAGLRQTVQALLAKLAEQLGLPREKLVEPHDHIRGAEVWYLGDKLALALSDNVLLASNDEGRLRDMLDLGAADVAEPAGLARRQDFAATRGERAADPTLWGWIDVAGIEQQTPEGGNKLRAMASDPGVHFLLGSSVATLGAAQHLALDLRLEESGLALGVQADGLPESVARETLYPLAGEAPAVPEAIAGDGAVGVLYRDFAGLLEHRTELFPPAVLPKFSEAIGNFSLLFGGGDITDEVLPNLSPWLGLVVRDPLFRGGAVPEVRLPGAALIAHLEQPEALGERLTAAFQSLIGFVNIDGAQKGRNPMLLDIELYEGVKISSAHFPTPAAGEGVDMRYNLEPACARVGDTFVLATHASLVRSIVGQLQRGELQRPEAASESLALSGATLARTVHANAEALAMNAVLNEGKQLEQARSDVAALEQIARLVESLRLSTERPAADCLRLELALELARESAK